MSLFFDKLRAAAGRNSYDLGRFVNTRAMRYEVNVPSMHCNSTT